MTDDVLTRERRETLLQRLNRLDAMLYPADDASPTPSGAERARIKDDYFKTLDEYFERLPRVVMSVCPFTGQLLKHSFDPYGLDGPWWHKDLLSEIKEPNPPSSFKILLGALRLGSREPNESKEEIIPGPEVPFVVPRLLGLPGMVAVVSELKLETGDVAYPIAYFSEAEIPTSKLHQPWLRQDLWFKTESGDASWLIANDKWDFDLAPWIGRRQLRWIVEREGQLLLNNLESGEKCPFVDLPGERRPQTIAFGNREFGESPNGVPFNPFAE